MDIVSSILSACERIRLADANEAATRLKVVDRVLREVLGWSDNDIDPEEHVSEDGNSTFADYVLTTANVGVVVETKKIGASFEIGATKRKERLTQAFVSGGVGDAIIQARDYCRKLSLDFGVVTNGDAWILFSAQRHDGVKFQDSAAIVFPSLKSALIDDYQEFVDLLSRDAVINGSLEVALIGRQENQLSQRTLGHLLGASGRTPKRNPIFPLIQPGIEIAFSDSITELDGDLLEKSYVSTPERIRFDQRIDMHLQKKASLFDVKPQRPMKSHERDALVTKISSALNRSKPVAVLVLGSVGSGKTTFLEFTRKVRTKSFFEKKKGDVYPHWIYVDFRAFTTGESAKAYIFKALLKYIKSDDYFGDFNRSIEPAYREDIDALKKGPLFLFANSPEKLNDKITDLIADEYSKVEPYVEKLMANAARRVPVFIVVDNIDQIEEEAIESKLLADVLAIGQLLHANIIISMRESTYTKYRSAPVFDAYDFDPIQIDSPKISSVLSKRFQLASFLLADKKGDFYAENGAHMIVDRVGDFIDLVQSSVLGTEVGKMIEVLATDDVRLALRMTRQFLETGYTNPGRALESYRKDRNYVLPRHEAFRAILQGGAPVYREESGTLGNPFDARLGRTEAQLLRLFVLASLVNHATLPSFRYVEVQHILEQLRKIGFGDRAGMKVLKDICTHRFAFNLAHSEVTEYSSLVPSRLGGYIVRELLTDFVFLEAMLMDTFVPDEAVWNEMRQLTQQIESERSTVARIDLRIKRVRSFFGLMSIMFEQLVSESIRRRLPKEWTQNPFNKEELGNELRRVRGSAAKNYGASSH